MARTVATSRIAASTRTATALRLATHPPASALSFDGSGDGVSVGNVFDKERTDSWSVSGWVYVNLIDANTKTVMSKYTAGNVGWSLYVRGSTGGLTLTLVNTAGSNQLSVEASAAIPLRRWVHIAMTYDGTSAPSGVKLYYDGVLQSNTTLANTLSAAITNAANTVIGATTTTTSPFNGFLTDIRLHNAVLTADEVKRLYQFNSATSVQAHWPFIDGTGSTLTAATGGANGTITGAAWTFRTPEHFAYKRIRDADLYPETLGPVVFRFMAEDVAGYADGASILAGNLYERAKGFRFSTVGGTVTYAATGLNGRPAILFGSNVASRLTIAGGTGNAVNMGNNFVAYGVAQIVTNGTNMIGGGNPFWFGFSSGTNLSWNNGAGVVNSAATFSTGTPYVLVFRRNGTAYSWWLNSTNVANSIAATTATCNMSTVGNYQPSNNPFQGYISEVGVIAKSLSDSDVTNLINYLRTKYGI